MKSEGREAHLLPVLLHRLHISVGEMFYAGWKELFEKNMSTYLERGTESYNNKETTKQDYRHSHYTTYNPTIITSKLNPPEKQTT